MIVIPAAGEGRRFAEAGYVGPKHLIPLGGVPMIDRVVANVRQIGGDDTVLVLTQDVVGKTRGTAETLAKAPLIDPDSELIIANCDQLLDLEAAFWLLEDHDGVIFTFQSCSPAHSYVVTDATDRITGIVEKRVVGDKAVSGVYWFREAGPILQACKRVCERADGELYLSHAIRMLIADGLDLRAADAPTAILGTPEDFQRMEVAMSMVAA